MPIGFAHRGARAHAPENTIEAFELAVRLGATGLESDVWLTADGVPVLDHDGVVRSGLRRRGIADVPRSDLPGHIPTLAEYYEAIGGSLPLSLDVKDPAAVGPTVAAAREAGGLALDNLFLCSPDWEQAASWRSADPDVHVVDSTRLRRMKEGPERRGATLRDAGVEVVNLHWSDWNAGLVALFHRFGLRCFAWDCQFRRQLDGMLRIDIDGVYSDHVDRMMDAIHGRPEVDAPARPRGSRGS